MQRPTRIRSAYADTSVFGGCFDEKFQHASRAFFEMVRKGQLVLIVSDTTLLELSGAPPHVKKLLTSLPPEAIERVTSCEEIEALRDAYLEAGVVGFSSARDAEHIASATVAEADFVVSWNFKHIVHVEKISGYQGVNLLCGYSAIRIFSPLEVT